MIKLSDYIVKKLKDYGVRYIFTITGGGAMHLNDSFGKEKSIQKIYNHHEQASSMAAESYARLTNKLGVCVVTSGPGGTNTLTGLIGAWQDSIPVLYLSGQVKRADSLKQIPNLRQMGIQENDIISMVKSVTKYAFQVNDAREIKYHLEKALYLAVSGRPGPVWLDIPLDIQSAMVDENTLKGFIAPEKSRPQIQKEIEEICQRLKTAKYPVIVAGVGIRQAEALEDFYKLINKLKIPVLASLLSQDLMWQNHPLFAGRFGVYGARAGNFVVQNSDLLIVIAARLGLWDTGYNYWQFAKNAYKVVIDNDPSELKKPNLKPSLAIVCDPGDFLKQMLSFPYQKKNYSAWLTQTKKWQKQFPVYLPEYRQNKKYVNYYFFVDTLSDCLSQKEIIVTGNGTAFTATHQAVKLKKGTRLLSNIGCASMGYDLPAVIGACFGANRKRVILITGDGSIQMNLQELQTIVHHHLPVKIFLINNNGYLAIRITQGSFFKRFYGTDRTNGLSFPDMGKIARAYGIKYLKISNQNGLKKKIRQVLKTAGPIICEIMMPPNQPLIPKPVSLVNKDGTITTTSLEDMYPFLPGKVLKENTYNNNLTSVSPTLDNKTGDASEGLPSEDVPASPAGRS